MFHRPYGRQNRRDIGIPYLIGIPYPTDKADTVTDFRWQATTKWGARGCGNSSADYADQTIADRVVLGSHLSVAWVGYKVRLTLFL